MNLYPLKFTPLSKYRIWGGNKLNTLLNKGFQADNIGESWEISDVEGGKTKVCNGALRGYSLQQLAAEYKDAFVGKNVYDSFGTDFPLLIKFIDAKTPLSIQVHPNDAVAKERHASFGKNEMWYVMQGDENAELIVGFDKALNKKSYQEYLDSNKILDVMHHETVQKGDTFYIPAGRVHAIGAGVLLAEIQQTSDVTYRIYDYERVDKQTGETRELHNDLALDVIDFEVHQKYKTDYSKEKNYSNTLVHAPYFKSNYLDIKGTIEKDYSGIDSFIIYICISGFLTLIENEISYSLVQGETILIPASINKINLHAESNAEILEVYY